MNVKVDKTTTKLSTIDQGEVFRFDGEYFIKTDETYNDSDYRLKELCVNLRTGVIARLCMSDDVISVDAELIIGRRK